MVHIRTREKNQSGYFEVIGMKKKKELSGYMKKETENVDDRSEML